MEELLTTTRNMFLTDSIIAVIVFLAMMVDLAAGLYKAKIRGDARRSEALKRTGYKFLIYEGGVVLASCMDLMIHMSKMYLILGWNMAWGVPFLTILMGIFWCVVEFLSVREKADEKIHSDISKAGKLAAQLLKLVEALKGGEMSLEQLEAIIDKKKNEKEEKS